MGCFVHGSVDDFERLDDEVSIVISVVQTESNWCQSGMAGTVELPSQLMLPLNHLRRLFRLGFFVEVFHFRATFFINWAGLDRGNFFLIFGISAFRYRPQAVTFRFTFFFTMMSASLTGSEYAIWSALVSLIPPASKRPRIIAQVGQDICITVGKVQVP